MLQMLHAEPLVALMQHNSVWLAVPPRTACILDMCCTGQLEGGPHTAQEVADTLGLVLPPPPGAAAYSQFNAAAAPEDTMQARVTQ